MDIDLAVGIVTFMLMFSALFLLVWFSVLALYLPVALVWDRLHFHVMWRWHTYRAGQLNRAARLRREHGEAKAGGSNVY